MFEVLFINLEARDDRRRFVESNFSEVNQQGWRLSRIPAVVADEVSPSQLGHGVSPVEGACFLSHRNALAQASDTPNHLLIVEDDVLFGPSSQQVIKAAIDAMAGADWDIMFTDIGIPHAEGMIDLFRDKGDLRQRQEFTLLDLNNRSFFGSTAYLVNRTSKAKFLSLVAEEARFVRAPYDLFLRAHIQAGQLKAFMIFPFATTVSHFGDQSQIQDARNTAELVWTSFRRLNWMDRDIDAAMKTIRKMEWPTTDQHGLLAMQELVSVMLSPRFALR